MGAYSLSFDGVQGVFHGQCLQQLQYRDRCLLLCCRRNPINRPPRNSLAAQTQVFLGIVPPVSIISQAILGSDIGQSIPESTVTFSALVAHSASTTDVDFVRQMPQSLSSSSKTFEYHASVSSCNQPQFKSESEQFHQQTVAHFTPHHCTIFRSYCRSRQDKG